MNRTLLKSIREYKKQSVLAPLFVILEVFMEVLIPLQMAKIIDVGIAKGDLGYIVKMGDSRGDGNACALVWCAGRKICCNSRSGICEKSAT